MPLPDSMSALCGPEIGCLVLSGLNSFLLGEYSIASRLRIAGFVIPSSNCCDSDMKLAGVVAAARAVKSVEWLNIYTGFLLSIAAFNFVCD